MTVKNRKSRSGVSWLIMLLILMIVIVSLLIGYLSRQQNGSSAEVTMTPESGGITLTESETDGAGEDSDRDDEGGDEDAAAAGGGASTPKVESNSEGSGGEGSGGVESTLEIGGQVVSVGAGRPNTRVFADADPEALVMGVYPDGSAFAVIEPSGEYRTYPVYADEVEWYRIRTEDGLVGWVSLDNLVLQE